MEKHEKERPEKVIFSKSGQKKIFEKAKEFVLNDLLPDSKINKILLFGSVANGTFGRYKKSWKHGYYSDIDALLLVENDFNAPKTWKVWYEHKNFMVYTHGWLDKKYLIQYMVWKKNKYQNKSIQKDVEKWGVPLLLEKGKNKFIIIYQKS